MRHDGQVCARLAKGVWPVTPPVWVDMMISLEISMQGGGNSNTAVCFFVDGRPRRRRESGG